MRRSTILAFATVSALALSVPNLVPATGIPVFDATQMVNALQQILTEGQQLMQQVQSYQQLLETYTHLLTNARQLAGIEAILAEVGVDPGILANDEARMLVNDLYALAADATDFYQQARALLELQYELPRDLTDVTDLAYDLFDPASAARVVEGYQKHSRDLDHYLQSANVISKAMADRAALAGEIQEIIAATSGLGDESEVATLHSIAAGTMTGLRQTDTNLQLQGVIADHALQEEIRRLEGEVIAAENGLARTRARAAWRTSPIADSDTNPLR